MQGEKSLSWPVGVDLSLKLSEVLTKSIILHDDRYYFSQDSEAVQLLSSCGNVFFFSCSFFAPIPTPE